MASTKSLSLLVIASVAWLNAFPAVAEEEKHPEFQKHRSDEPGGNWGKTPAASGITSGASAPPQATENRTETQSNTSSIIGNILIDALFGPSSPQNTETRATSDSPGTKFLDLSTEVRNHKYLAYFGLSGGESKAYYPSESLSKFAWQLFLGGRAQYYGTEFEYSSLGTVAANINTQQLNVNTDTYSLSLLGYIPVSNNADLYFRYGLVNWKATTYSYVTGNFSHTEGYDRVSGMGFEYRKEAGFLRVEKEIYRNVYQSKFHSFAGIKLGAYFY